MKIQYSRLKNGRRYWEPSKRLTKLGFEAVCCGTEGKKAQAKASELTSKALYALSDDQSAHPRTNFIAGSISHFIDRYERSQTFRRRGTGSKTKALEGHKLIEKHLGSRKLSSLTADDVYDFFENVERENGPYARWHSIKTLKCILDEAVHRELLNRSPAERVRNPQPEPRSEIWSPDEIAKLVAKAQQLDMTAMSLAIRLLDECGFSPVDARTIEHGMLEFQGGEHLINRERSKTGNTGLWAISRELGKDIELYIESLRFDLTPNAQIFRRHVNSRQSGQPLPWRNTQEFSRDFKHVREATFGPTEKRQAGDIRRTVSVDTDLAGMSKAERAAMLANGMDRSSSLHKVYTPETREAAIRARDMRNFGRSFRTNQDSVTENGKRSLDS